MYLLLSSVIYALKIILSWALVEFLRTLKTKELLMVGFICFLIFLALIWLPVFFLPMDE